jgi:lipoprotein-anchoring transpeptidase ErfK/SrfK
MRRAALVPFLGAAMALVAPLPALADDAVASQQQVPAPTPAPSPGKLTWRADTPITVHGRPYVLAGDTVTILGRVAPYVPGQKLRVRISAPKRKAARVRVRIGKGGAFRVRFRTRRAVKYTLYARHDGTPQQAFFAARGAVTAVTPGRRMAVVLLKQGLRALGYPAGYGSAINDKLARSLLAFRKTNNLARVYTPDRHIYEMVFAGRGAFKLRFPNEGKHVEADISRQVLVLADKGKPLATYPTSSGASATPTVLGHYRFYLKAAGTNAKGMYMSNYFIRGYAIHGYPSVPTYNASHGCLRVPNADAVTIFNWIRIGDPIWVYP